MEVEPATARDLPEIVGLLTAAGLTLDGAAAAFETGVLARDSGRVVAVAAVEPFGSDGLLRSVAVAQDRRGEGFGRAIVEATERLARDLGIAELYLLTETAAIWFPRLGYTRIDRSDVPSRVQASVEFAMACSETAVAMRRTMAPG